MRDAKHNFSLPTDAGDQRPRHQVRNLYAEFERAGVFRPARWFHALWFGVAFGVYLVAYLTLVSEPHLLVRVVCIGALGVAFVQLGLIAHEIGHGAVTKNAALRSTLGQFVNSFLVGFSFNYWLSTHRPHHAHPNTEATDPDVESQVFALYENAARRARGAKRWVARLQPWCLPPAFLLWAVVVKWDSAQFIARHLGRRTLIDALCMAAHFSAWLLVPTWWIDIRDACLNYCAILAIKGVYMGGILVVPHLGLGTRRFEERMSFFERQVRFSRNHEGPLLWTMLCGGLNLQIEHHLLPHVPWIRLPRAQPIVERYCNSHGLPYRCTSYSRACQDVSAHLRIMARIAADSGDVSPTKSPKRQRSLESLPERHPQ